MPNLLAVVTTCWGLVMALAPLLQIRVIVRERNATGVSVGWIAILLVGFLLWFTYGVVNQDAPLIITNMVSITIALGLLITVRIYRSRSSEASAGTQRA